MLLLVLFLVFCSFLNVTGINLTYIVKKDENAIHPSCIAEELERYAAVGWVYPIPSAQENLPEITSKFIPTINNDYNCQFSKNSLCNTRWSLRDWKIDESSPRTRELITDRRWEDLPTILISNTSKEFSERVEIDNVFKTGFSVRAEGLVEIFVCSGWNPYDYPCYYFHIDYREIFFKKFETLPKELKDDYKTNALGNYKAYSNILSSKEWRNFVISSDTDGLIKLIDVNLNRTLIEHSVKEPLTPMYMFMRSTNSSLWKIHQNHFLYTSGTQISRLGPQLTVSSKDLCVSLFVETCSKCEMNFFYQNGSVRKILKRVGPTKNGNWMEIKLKEENIQLEKLNLFVETKLLDNNSSLNNFWAIDDVRVCNENEVKVSFLKIHNMRENVSEDDITCQLVRKPSWRPKKLTYNKIKDFPKISSYPTTNSIKLKWAQEDPANQISYFLSYQAIPLLNDSCSTSYDSIRTKSNGFVSTKLNEIVLEKLVPYTKYNITVSTVLHEKDKKILAQTLETVEPSLEELPFNIQLKALDTSLNVSWESIDCSKKFGRLVYTLIVSNEKLNFTREISLQTDTSYKISDLEPYTHYTLKILTARNGRNMYKGIHTSEYFWNFTTMAGVAPPIHHLELYSIDAYSASLRYELPSDAHGVIREVQVRKCNSLSYSKCKTSISPIRPCNLWPGKYCIDVDYLIPSQSYSFKVSLRNVNTPSFGEEMSIDGFTAERVPGRPTNATYKIVDCHESTDYCHLNVTWLHPFDQNGTITYFNIILNSTDKRKDTEDDKYIHEVYKVENKTYYHHYTYQIKYLPYSTYYNLYLQSANSMYKSDFTELTIKTDNIGDHIDQSPKLIAKSESTLLFKIPRLDRRLDSYTLTVVVQDNDKSKKIDSDLVNNAKIAENVCWRHGDTWISQTLKVYNSSTTENIVIDGVGEHKLVSEKRYCVTFIITNRYKGSEHDVVYYEKLVMPSSHSPPTTNDTSSGSFNHLYMLLLLLLLIPVVFIVYRCLRKKKMIATSEGNNDNVYETLPFDECEPNDSEASNGKAPSFSNKTYD